MKKTYVILSALTIPLFTAISFCSAVSITIPTKTGSAPTTILVDPNSILSLNRFTVPTKSEYTATGTTTISSLQNAAAPFYYPITVKNAQFSPAAATSPATAPTNTKPNDIESTVYLGITYDQTIPGWRDISGIEPSLTTSRVWPEGVGYFISSALSPDSKQVLCAFASDNGIFSVGTPQASILIKQNTKNDILLNPSRFFGSTNSPSKVLTISMSLYMINGELFRSGSKPVYTIPNTLIQQAPLTADTPNTANYTVTFPVIDSTTPATYTVSPNQIIMISSLNAPTAGTAAKPVIAEQFFMATSSEGSPQPPVANQIGMMLNSYYLVNGSYLIAIAPIDSKSTNGIPTQFTTAQIPGADPVAKIQLSADKSTIMLTGTPYFEPMTQCSSNVYFDCGWHNKKNNGIVSTSNLYGFVIAAEKHFFEGQVNFYAISLDKLQSITKEALTQNPYILFPFGANALTQRARNTTSLLTQLSPIPVTFTTSDTPAQTLNGVIAFNMTQPGTTPTNTLTQQFPYYLDLPTTSSFILYYADTTGTLNLLANDLSNSKVVQINYLPDSALASWPAGLFDAFTATTKTFVQGASLDIGGAAKGFWQKIKDALHL